MWICYEGPEHTGKSTGIEMLRKSLEEDGEKVLVTKEPGSPHDPLTVKLRKLLLDTSNDILDKTAMFLFLADRSQHMAKVIEPALKEGKIVISDRSSLSTLFYYAAKDESLDKEELDRLYRIISYAQGEIRPDICLIANAEYRWAKRSMISRAELDRIELKGDSFHEKVHELFKSFPTEYDNRECKGFVAKQTFHLPSIPKYSSKEVAEYALNKVNQIRNK